MRSVYKEIKNRLNLRKQKFDTREYADGNNKDKVSGKSLADKPVVIDVNPDLVAQVKAKKLELRKLGSYKDNPKLSIIVLSFNHKQNIKLIIERLRMTVADEIIVCEDGSIDGSLDEWIKYLEYPNDFLIRSNDLHEIRAYDRAINLARGEYVCVMQDDDIPPDDNNWVNTPLSLFNLYPDLAIIGGFQGRIFGDNSYRYGYMISSNKIKMPFIQPKLKVPFAFVHGVNVGPIFYRKDAYIEMGGFDHTFSKPGESGIHFDYEICLRAWLNGYKVGLYSSLFVRHVGIQGTITFGLEERQNNDVVNMQNMKDKYWNELDIISVRVNYLNNLLIRNK